MFLTPIISPVLRLLSLLILKLIGWRIVGDKPADPKYIVVAAPHTSNWDFIMFVLAAFVLRYDAHWMGKDSLFRFPIKHLMLWLGGIPIDRSKSNDVVNQMADYYKSVNQLAVIITPEGTRSKVDRWKTGFYHIALKAQVPLALAFIDAKTKTIGFGQNIIPSGDMDADLAKIKQFYSDKKGINAKNF